MDFFATTAKGMEPLLVAELRALGATTVDERRAGCAFSGPLDLGYRACLWSRVANRILLPLGTFASPDDKALYEGVRTLRWSDHLTPTHTLAVDFSSSRSGISHDRYGALKTKDAIVDQLRDLHGARPSIDTHRPDVRVNVHLASDVATVSIDLSGESLHRRGWRGENVEAPLKENLAAALLLLAGWPERARAGAPLLDPMCGSGTIPVEAAFIAADIAPGLRRPYFGFLRWPGHERSLWDNLLGEAREREIRDPKKLPPIVGHDADSRAVRIALENLERAGLRGRVHFEKKSLEECRPIPNKYGQPAPGLLIANPPYGERLGDAADLAPLYRQIGDLLRREFPGWHAAIFTGNQELAKSIGLRPARRHVLWNGPIECRLLEIPISAQPVKSDEGPAWRKPRPPRPESEAFSNRLRKNLRHLRKWARREEISCFRAYDGDLPEYAVAVDLYENAAHVQEYAPPATVDAARAEERLRDIMTLVPEVLELPPEEVHLKVRRRQRGAAQYEKLDEKKNFREVREGGLRFLVNLTDYLDTGLFLDHRLLRALLRDLAKGRDFLNLFAYTATATVYAAAGGARSTTSVDLSNTYLDWARENLAINRIGGPKHTVVRADCLEWLTSFRPEGAASRRESGLAAPRHEKSGLIFLAPPTFSNSKGMRNEFDLQRDYPALLRATAQLLTPDGILLFSSNFRRFKLDPATLPELAIENISKKTLPLDFERNPRIHATWKVTRR